MYVKCIKLNLSLIGSCQGVFSKSVDNMWPESWITKKPIGTFLCCDLFSVINSSSVNEIPFLWSVRIIYLIKDN